MLPPSEEEDGGVRPGWDDLTTWVRAEAEEMLDRGPGLCHTLVLFEDDQATVYVRSRLRHPDRPGDDQLLLGELFALGWTLRPTGACIACPVNLRADGDDGLVSLAGGSAGVALEWVRRGDGAGRDQGALVIPYRLDDGGQVIWEEPETLERGGPFREHLEGVVGEAEVPVRAALEDGFGPAELAYTLTRFGLVVGVDRRWRGRYGFDAPLDPRMVRREDARRARGLRRRATVSRGARR